MATIERIYDFTKRKKRPEEYAVLVDRLWPRGISKEDVNLDEWMKEIAPSNELRKWFGHDPEKWNDFRERYKAELKQKEGMVEHLISLNNEKANDLVLLYAAKDEEHNQAVVLNELL